MPTKANCSNKFPDIVMIDSDLCIKDFVASDYHALVLPGHHNFARCMFISHLLRMYLANV